MTAKSRPKDHSAPTSKKRKPRVDSAQKKPVFAQLTNAVGLEGRSGKDADWQIEKSKSGKLLHPFLVAAIKRGQEDYDHAILPHPSVPHVFLGSEPLNVEIQRLQEIYARKCKREPLDQGDRHKLRIWTHMTTEARVNTQQLVQAVVAAAACGDVAFFEHLALIVQCLGKSRSLPAIPKNMAVEKAYDAVLQRRLLEAVQKKDHSCKGLRAILEIARNSEKLKQEIRPPDRTDVDEEIVNNPNISSLVPDWQETNVFNRYRQIERVCAQLDKKLVGKRHRKAAK